MRYLKTFLFVLALIFTINGCTKKESVYRGFYDGLKQGQELKDIKDPNSKDNFDKKDQSYKQYIDEIEKSNF